MPAVKLIKTGLVIFIASTIVLMVGSYLSSVGWQSGQLAEGGGNGALQFIVGIGLLGLAGISNFTSIALIIVGLIIALVAKSKNQHTGSSK